MYDYDDSDGSDYSFEDSDYEYNSLEPYTYELNGFKIDIQETPEEKLLKFIQTNDLVEIHSLIPSLLKEDDHSASQLNGKSNVNNNVYESGDAASDDSNDEYSDIDEEEDKCDISSRSKYKEILLKNDDTPLILAATEGNAELVKYFLSLGFNVNYKVPNTNKTALLALFSKSNSSIWGIGRDSETIEKLIECLKVLIDAGGDVRAKGFITTPDYGSTALHLVVQNDYWEMVDLLINAGADVDAVNNEKLTALHIAATKGHVVCCNNLLLAGANAKLTDKSGNTAADLAELEGHIHLSDAINVYCGNAQHNVRLYNIWRQYAPQFKHLDHDTSFTDIGDNLTLSHSSIESFALALNAPYLTKIMEDQGIGFDDLKFMDEPKLQELGIPEKDCSNILNAMKDLNKKPKIISKKINFSYGKPLKSITMLEMIGNIGEHTEFIDTNIESMFCHLNRNEKFYLEKYKIVNKSTVNNLQSNTKKCIETVNLVEERAENLKMFINQQQNQDSENCVYATAIPHNNNDHKSENMQNNHSNIRTSIFVTSILVVSLSVAFLSKRFL